MARQKRLHAVEIRFENVEIKHQCDVGRATRAIRLSSLIVSNSTRARRSSMKSASDGVLGYGLLNFSVIRSDSPISIVSGLSLVDGGRRQTLSPTPG